MTGAAQFCGSCGVLLTPDLRFCRNCGAAVPAAALGAQAYRRRPLWLVALLTFGTASIYYVFWFGASWAEIKRRRGDASMRPGWHALTQLVPVYGLFRAHAHFTKINGVMSEAGASARTRPGLAVAGLVLASALSIAANVPGPHTGWSTIAGLTCYAAFVVHGQWGLNRAWTSAADVTAPERILPLEWFLAAISALFAVLVVIGVTLTPQP